MDSEQLAPWQADKIFNQLRPHLQYLNRLRDRMEQTGFPRDDKLFVLVTTAHTAMQELFVAMHYASVPSGVGRKARD